MNDNVSVDRLVDALIDREGGFVNHPADKGGPTCFGVTEAVARTHGYGGPMRHLPREEAAGIYKRLYWLRPRFDEIAKRSPRLAGELFDTGANMGPAVAVTFLQRTLTALNRNGKDRTGASARRRCMRSTLSSRLEVSAEERRCCCARSRRFRANATSVSPSGGQPMRRSFMGGSRTGSVISDSLPMPRQCEHS